MKKRILVYGVNQEVFDLIERIGGKMDLSVSGLNDSDLNLCMNDCMQHLFHHETEEKEMPYLFFMEMDGETIREFVSSLRKEGYAFAGILVSKTEVNASWSFTKLMTETLQERIYMETKAQLHHLMNSFDREMIQKIIKAEDKETQTLLMGAFVMMKENHPVDMMKHMIDELKEKYELYHC